MKEKFMSTHISGLKCDNPDCNWEDPSIQLNEYPDWVGKGCPLCGEVVLTNEAWQTVQKIICIENAVNRFSGLLKPLSKKRQTKVGVRFTLDKKGKIHFKGENNEEI